jgi:hypothetical protein
VLVFSSPPVELNGYVLVSIVNPDGQITSQRLLFTDDCPTEGQFGKGLDCKPCPEGGRCPGGYLMHFIKNNNKKIK